MRAVGHNCPHPRRPACSATDTRPTTTRAGAPDPGTGHLHGLGVDPADGSLYAAGHLGAFRLGPTGAVRIVTAASRTHLPAADTKDAVYESKDGGGTWTVVHRPGQTNTGH
ncbi:hypothetical protein AB0B78_23830 [Streptomyces sp. NPDC040724]|uniref:hypothetical protein n=1 Tax=unclassified Streptomyces TaxID=2593676 RepID=UPI0033BFE852